MQTIDAVNSFLFGVVMCDIIFIIKPKNRKLYKCTQSTNKNAEKLSFIT